MSVEYQINYKEKQVEKVKEHNSRVFVDRQNAEGNCSEDIVYFVQLEQSERPDPDQHVNEVEQHHHYAEQNTSVVLSTQVKDAV